MLLALAGGFPALTVALFYVMTEPWPASVRYPLAVALAGCWAGLGMMMRDRAAFPWRTMSNMLGAIREGDYSIRARVPAKGAVSEALAELNLLGDSLRARRLETVETAALLHKVLEEIDAAIFTFDERERLRLVNRAGARLLSMTAEQAVGLSAAELGVRDLLRGEPGATVGQAFPGAAGRWTVRRASFRESGMPHELLVLSDVTRELREEELIAWQRLVRVLGHELNNSLAPVQSIAHSMEKLIRSEPLPEDWREDVIQGLEVIAARSQSLSRFVGAYAQLARLPKPVIQSVDLSGCVARVLELRKTPRVDLHPGPPLMLAADPDQVEQALINLLQNALEAVEADQGRVRLGWRRSDAFAEIEIEDEGQGLANPANLFVPFFSTKPGGSGIGLVLCRKIAEAHEGSVTVENRPGCRGTVARLRLPLALTAANTAGV
jgi:two-component system, NtrC family, nitrogen regulation sensor histidine kinase NtrY